MWQCAHMPAFRLSHRGARTCAFIFANMCLRLTTKAETPLQGLKQFSPRLLLLVHNGLRLRGCLYTNSWGPPPGPLVISEQQFSPHVGVGAVAQAHIMRSKRSFLFQDIKAFENQGPYAIETRALGAGVLCLCQRGQF